MVNQLLLYGVLTTSSVNQVYDNDRGITYRIPSNTYAISRFDKKWTKRGTKVFLYKRRENEKGN